MAKTKVKKGKVVVEKKVLVVMETMGKELTTATNNERIRSPYLPDEDKVLEPLGYVEPDDADEDIDAKLFEDGELSYAKKAGLLHQAILDARLSYDYDTEEEIYTVYLMKGHRAVERFMYVDAETKHYTFAIGDETLEDPYRPVFASRSMADMWKFIRTMPFKVREKQKVLVQDKKGKWS